MSISMLEQSLQVGDSRTKHHECPSMLMISENSEKKKTNECFIEIGEEESIGACCYLTCIDSAECRLINFEDFFFLSLFFTYSMEDK